MLKRVFGRKFSRDASSRRALLRSLIRALILNGSMETTKARALAIQGSVDGLIIKSRREGVHAKRNILSSLGGDREALEKLFRDVTPGLSDRNFGFTKITNLPARRGDSAKVVRIEWANKIGKEKEKEAAVKTDKDGKKEKKND